jgi:hypothetical protein
MQRDAALQSVRVALALTIEIVRAGKTAERLHATRMADWPKTQRVLLQHDRVVDNGQVSNRGRDLLNEGVSEIFAADILLGLDQR